MMWPILCLVLAYCDPGFPTEHTTRKGGCDDGDDDDAMVRF